MKVLALLAAAALLASASSTTTTTTCTSIRSSRRIRARGFASSSPLNPKPYKGDQDISILQLLRKDRRFTKLVTALTRAGGQLRDDLDDTNARNKVTLLSPTDEAFEVLEKIHGQTVDTMSGELLQKLLAYHVIPSETEHDETLINDGYAYDISNTGRRNSWRKPSVDVFDTKHDVIRKDDLTDGETLETALIDSRLGDHHDSSNRQRVRVSKYAGKVIFNMYAQVIDADMEAANGVVHALADVLMLPEQLFTGVASLPYMFSTHALALKLTGLDKRVDQERGVTAFVPSNGAWESLGFFQTMELFHPANRDELKEILLRHYISEPIYVNELIANEFARGTRAGRTCEAARIGDAAYFDALRRKLGSTSRPSLRSSVRNGMRYYAEHLSGRLGVSRRGEHKDEFEKEFETWAGQKITVRVECHEGGVDVLVGNSVVSLADIPAGNGALHVLTQPIDAHTQNRRDDDDNDHGDDIEEDIVRVRRSSSLPARRRVSVTECTGNEQLLGSRSIVRRTRSTVFGVPQQAQMPFVFPGLVL